MSINQIGCERKESQIEIEMKNLSHGLSQLEEVLPTLFSTLHKILAPEISMPITETPLDKKPEILCPLADDMRHNTRRVKEMLDSVKEITKQIRL